MTSHPRRRVAAIALLAVGLGSGLAVQAQPPDTPPGVPTFGATTELVYLRFHVEKKGDYQGGIVADQLRVLEDGQPQVIALLETPSTRQRTIPPEVTLALDVSGSVMDPGLLDESLVREALFAGLDEQARVGLCAFGGELRCLRPPTRDASSLLAGFQEAIEFGWQTRRGGTRLYASIAEICQTASAGERSQRAVIIFSDGLDNRGGHVKDAIDAALAADVRIYSVLLSQAFQATARTVGPYAPPPNRALYDYKKLDLGHLAEETGGRSYEPGTLDRKSLASILRSIATEISMENVIGYQPQGPATGRKRKVKVELVDKSLGKIRDGERTLVR